MGCCIFEAMGIVMQEKEYLTEVEACTYLGVSRGTLFNYVKRKVISRYQQHAPRQTLYKRSELESLKQVRLKNRHGTSEEAESS